MIAIGLSLLGGGAAGAVINQMVTSYRARRQPIGYRFESAALFSPPSETAGPSFRVTFTPIGGSATELANLHTLRVELINRGNSDRARMLLGLTLPVGQNIVHAEKTTGDRHHRMTIQGELNPSTASNEIDVLLEPFNRGDTYTLTLYVTLPPDIDEVGLIVPSSSEAVRFVELPNSAQVASEALDIGLSITPAGSVIGQMVKRFLSRF